jgi:dephospho-CoA kinase
MKLIGLTGGIASGKSTAGRLLAARGVPVVDADVLAREAVVPGSPGLAAIVARFGGGILQADGALDRKALGAIVFADADARRDLNAIVHPEVARLAADKLAALRESGAPAAVYEVPLLFESGLEPMFDAILVVACSDETQLHRLMQRDGLDEAAARQRLAAQMPLADKRARATRVIENEGGVDALDAVTWRAWSEVLARDKP